MASGRTTINNLPYPAETDSFDPAADIQQAMTALDPILAPIGVEMPYAGSGDPTGGSWLLADGRLIDRTTYAAFFTAVGHKYNGGVDPGSNKVRIPDKRGRASLGADNMGTTQGAASRLTVAAGHNNTAGQNGGEEAHTLTAAESGTNGSGATQAIDIGNAMTYSGVIAGHVNNLDRAQAGNGGAIGPGVSTATNIGSVGLTGRAADNAHNNVGPYEVDNVIVRVA